MNLTPGWRIHIPILPPSNKTSTSETHHVKEVETEETATRTLSRTKNDVLLNSETEAVCLREIKLRLDYLEISFDNILDA